MAYWLLKSEPSMFALADLQASAQQTTRWDGVRNYQVRNLIRDTMRPNDEGFFYHSSCPEPGIVGVVRIVSEAYPDPTAFDPASPYYDPSSDPNHPRWLAMDVRLIRPVPLLSLAMLRQYPPLSEMLVLRKGNRFSITPLTPEQWRFILDLRPA